MDLLMGLIVGGAVGAVVAWIFLPEPAFVRRFFVKIGWAKPVA